MSVRGGKKYPQAVFRGKKINPESCRLVPSTYVSLVRCGGRAPLEGILNGPPFILVLEVLGCAMASVCAVSYEGTGDCCVRVLPTQVRVAYKHVQAVFVL